MKKDMEIPLFNQNIDHGEFMYPKEVDNMKTTFDAAMEILALPNFLKLSDKLQMKVTEIILEEFEAVDK